MEKKNKKRNNKTGYILPLAVVVIAAIGELKEDFFNNGKYMIIAMATVLVIVLVLVSSRWIKTMLAKSTSGENPFSHSHDRLSKAQAAVVCSEEEHWKSQLDGFLKAGIIDRAEYNERLNNRVRQQSSDLR